jgi:NitT/TauT family transport system substrate-binding protein
MTIVRTRRQFLTTLSLSGVVGFVGTQRLLATEVDLETRTVRLAKDPAPCSAPLHVAEELLRAEGFSDVRYLPSLPGVSQAQRIARGELDFSMFFAPELVVQLDRGVTMTALTGSHVGCFELVGNEAIQTVGDLKGKSVGVPQLRSPPHFFASVIAAHIGIDPVRDINWVASRSPKPVELFATGKIDAFLGLPPDPDDLRARHIGHVVVDSIVDRPWSEYFCCMLVGNRDFIQKFPVATKRVVRAILKAIELCATDPSRAAQQFLDHGLNGRYDYVLQTLKELPYGKWRDYDAEDTIRFYALRLHEAGMIKSSPQKIIADGTDWRFLNELKRELKT